MTIDDGPRLHRESWGYAAGTCSVLMAAALRLGLGSVIDGTSFFLLLPAAVTAAAWSGGARPALATTLLGALAGSSALFPTGRAFSPADPADAVGLGLFLLQGGLISMIVGRLALPSLLVQ